MVQTRWRRFEFNSTITLNEQKSIEGCPNIFQDFYFQQKILERQYTFSICIKYGMDIEKVFIAGFLLDSGTLQSFVLILLFYG